MGIALSHGNSGADMTDTQAPPTPGISSRVTVEDVKGDDRESPIPHALLDM